jgi:type 1 glutamine amidotransferase
MLRNIRVKRGHWRGHMPPNRADNATALKTDGKERAISIRSRKYPGAA